MIEQSTEKDNIKSIAAGGLIGIIAILLSSVLRLAVAGLLTRVLDPESYGHYVLAFSLIMLLSGFSSLGMPKAVLRWGALPAEQDRIGTLRHLIPIVFRITLPFTLLVAVATFSSADLIEGLFSGGVISAELRLFLLAIPLIVLAEILAAVARTTEDVINYFAIKEILPAALQLTAVAIATLLFANNFAVILCLIGAYLMACCYGVFYVVNRVRGKREARDARIEKVSLRVLLTFGTAVSAIGILGFLKDRMIFFLIGKYLTAAEAGIFFNASRVAILATIVLTGLNAILAPKIASLHSRGNRKELERIYQSVMRWSIFAVFPFLAFSLLRPSDVMWLIFGDTSEMAAQLLAVLIIFRFMSSLTGPTGTVFLMTGVPRYEVIANFVFVILASGAAFLALPRWGTLGGAVVGGLVALLVDLWRMWIVRRTVGIAPMPIKHLAVIIMLLVACGLFNALLRQFVVAELEIFVAVGAVFLSSLALIFLIATADDLFILNWVKDRVTTSNKV